MPISKKNKIMIIHLISNKQNSLKTNTKNIQENQESTNLCNFHTTCIRNIMMRCRQRKGNIIRCLGRTEKSGCIRVRKMGTIGTVWEWGR